jgi:hypothetical protein
VTTAPFLSLMTMPVGALNIATVMLYVSRNDREKHSH